MSHSNSSLNLFTSCMHKYYLSYIKGIRPDVPESPHLKFGVMAHDTLYKAGKLRDEVNDGVVSKDKYYQIIPSEVLYPDLKQEFQIKNWNNYFVPIIKEIAGIENGIIKEWRDTYKNEGIIVERELKLQLDPVRLQAMGIKVKQPLVGIIDFLIYTPNRAIILDYKFSSSRKTQDDFDMNSQLPIYAMLIHMEYGIPLRNIQYGYIDIPKMDFGKPTVLTNGKLSRAKGQNVSQELYEKAVIAVHGEDDYYNCKPGGYYYDCWCNLALNKPCYLSIQYLDIDVYNNVTADVLHTAEFIDKLDEKDFLRKYDSYSCKNCDYLKYCKGWLNVNDEE